MGHGLLYVVCMLFLQPIPDDNEALRQICHDRIVELSESREFERAETVARVSKKKFPNDPRFESLHRDMQSARYGSIRHYAKQLPPDFIVVAKYQIDKFKGLDPTSRDTEMNKLADTIIERFAPDYWSCRTIVQASPSHCVLIICTSRENHEKIHEIVGIETLQSSNR